MQKNYTQRIKQQVLTEQHKWWWQGWWWQGLDRFS